MTFDNSNNNNNNHHHHARDLDALQLSFSSSSKALSNDWNNNAVVSHQQREKLTSIHKEFCSIVTSKQQRRSARNLTQPPKKYFIPDVDDDDDDNEDNLLPIKTNPRKENSFETKVVANEKSNTTSSSPKNNNNNKRPRNSSTPPTRRSPQRHCRQSPARNHRPSNTTITTTLNDPPVSAPNISTTTTTTFTNNDSIVKKPEPVLDAFGLFRNKIQASLEQQHPHLSHVTLRGMIWNEWNQLSAIEKLPYEQTAKQLQYQYQQQLKQYQRQQKQQQKQQKSSSSSTTTKRKRKTETGSTTTNAIPSKQIKPSSHVNERGRKAIVDNNNNNPKNDGSVLSQPQSRRTRSEPPPSLTNRTNVKPIMTMTNNNNNKLVHTSRRRSIPMEYVQDSMLSLWEKDEEHLKKNKQEKDSKEQASTTAKRPDATNTQERPHQQRIKGTISERVRKQQLMGVAMASRNKASTAVKQRRGRPKRKEQQQEAKQKDKNMVDSNKKDQKKIVVPQKIGQERSLLENNSDMSVDCSSVVEKAHNGSIRLRESTSITEKITTEKSPPLPKANPVGTAVSICSSQQKNSKDDPTESRDEFSHPKRQKQVSNPIRVAEPSHEYGRSPSSTSGDPAMPKNGLTKQWSTSGDSSELPDAMDQKSKDDISCLNVSNTKVSMGKENVGRPIALQDENMMIGPPSIGEKYKGQSCQSPVKSTARKNDIETDTACAGNVGKLSKCRTPDHSPSPQCSISSVPSTKMCGRGHNAIDSKHSRSSLSTQSSAARVSGSPVEPKVVVYVNPEPRYIACGQCVSCLMTRNCRRCLQCMLIAEGPPKLGTGVEQNLVCIQRICIQPVLNPKYVEVIHTVSHPFDSMLKQRSSLTNISIKNTSEVNTETSRVSVQQSNSSEHASSDAHSVLESLCDDDAGNTDVEMVDEMRYLESNDPNDAKPASYAPISGADLAHQLWLADQVRW